MTKRGKVAVYVISVALGVFSVAFYTAIIAEEYDPTVFEVGLHGTDLYRDAGDPSPINVFDGAGVAVTIDLVSNPGDVFGEGEVPVGTYNRMRLTLANLVSVAGTNPCDEISAYAGTFLINDALAPDAQVEVFYATVEDGGDSMIHADGSAGAPFLMMSPIVVEADETTVVNLAFYTSGSLVCNGGPPGGTVELRPPSLTVASYIEGEPQVVDPSGEYWFVHFNVNGHLYNEHTGDWLDPEKTTTHDLLNRIHAGTGWGSITLGAPDPVSGTGSWSIADASWRSGGFGEHRHSFSQWDAASDEGYAGTAPNLPLTGTYQLTGNHVFLKIGSSAAMEGYIAENGRSFILVNIAGVDDSDVVFAVSKASGYPSDVPAGTYVIVSPQMEFRYDTSGSSPYPATGAGFNGALVILRGGIPDDFFSWGTNLQLDYVYKGDIIYNVSGQIPEESSEYQAGIISGLEFDSSGFATTSPEDSEMFLAMGGDGVNGYLGLFAGQGVEDDGGEHRLSNGFIVEADDAPAVSDLTGRWALMGVNWEGSEGDDGTWGTGDEGYELLTTLGIIEFNGTGGITWSFTDKNVITQAITSDRGSGDVYLTTEYYELGNPVNSDSPTAIPLPLFHVTESAGSSTVAAKLVLDKGGDTVLFWSPLDSGNIPQDGSTHDAANRFTMGAAVRIE